MASLTTAAKQLISDRQRAVDVEPSTILSNVSRMAACKVDVRGDGAPSGAALNDGGARGGSGKMLRSGWLHNWRHSHNVRL